MCVCVCVCVRSWNTRIHQSQFHSQPLSSTFSMPRKDYIDRGLSDGTCTEPEDSCLLPGYRWIIPSPIKISTSSTLEYVNKIVYIQEEFCSCDEGFWDVQMMLQVIHTVLWQFPEVWDIQGARANTGALNAATFQTDHSRMWEHGGYSGDLPCLSSNQL